MANLGGEGPPGQVPSPPATLDIDHADIADAPGHELGRGSSSIVRRVELDQPGRSIPLAVKIPDYEGTLAAAQFERFASEADTWASLSDTGDETDGLGRADHIVDVVSWGTEPLPWIAMEYMDGGSLRALLDDGDGRLPLDQALWVGTAVCEAVIHAHRHGVAHLDIKPSNVLFRNTSRGWPLPKVADWGLARVLLDATETEKALTPAYAAPEQFHPDRYGKPEHETDIYQVGVLMYELVTGRLPFQGASSEIRTAKTTADPPLPSEIADAPATLDDVLVTALGREKTERYEEMVYLRDELNALFEQYHGNQTGNYATESAVDRGEQLVDGQNIAGREPTDAPVESDQPTHERTPAPDSDTSEVTSWNEYKRDLENRKENAVLYGLLGSVLYRDLSAEWEYATDRREEARAKYESRATGEARDMLDTLEGQIGERGEKLFGDPLPDNIDPASRVEETRVKLEDLLRDYHQYLTVGERELAVERRDDLAWYERYLQAKRRLDEAITESAARLDEIAGEIDETLDDDSLLAAEAERSLARQLDNVSETLRRVERSLDTEVLTDQDLERFQELLRREQTLRERIERHNPDLTQRRYSEHRESATSVRDRTGKLIGGYRRDGTEFPELTDTHRSALDEQCEAIDEFLDSRHAEWLSTDQRNRLEELRDELDTNRAVIESKRRFEARLATLQEDLSGFRTTVTETLDGESYLDTSTRAMLEEQLDLLRSRRDDIEADDLLDPLTDTDRERFDECAVAIETFETALETYNPNLVQRRYDRYVEMATDVLAGIDDDLEPCRADGGPLPLPTERYVRPLDSTIQTISWLLEEPQSNHLEPDQREQVESLRDRLVDRKRFVSEKEAFEAQLQQVHEALADLRMDVDETLDMESYLTAARRDELETRADRVDSALQTITDEGLLDLLGETDVDRFDACRAALDTLETRIRRYNDRFVAQERKRLNDMLEPLSVEQPNRKQQLAVVRNERHNRAIAGPGTGKTYSLLCRVRYLVGRGVPPEELLVLAFNKHTSSELERRLEREFDIPNATVRTLHSFGRSLVSDAYPDEFVLVGQPRLREIGRLVRELRESDDSVRQHYEEFIELYRSERFSTDQDVREDRYDSLRFQSGKTLRGEELEPGEEEPREAHARIARTLFEYGVDYRYRQYAAWADPSDGDPYIPDFTLPEYDISIDYLPSEATRRRRKWYEKRRTGAQISSINAGADRTSVTIHGDDIPLDSIEAVLKAQLDEAGVPIADPKSEDELIRATYEHNVLWRDIESHLGEFVKKAKTNRIEPSERLDSLDADENPLSYHFSHVGAAVFDAYETRYADYGAYDYEDMMLRASEIASEGSVDDALGYRHVLVDEFQDLDLTQIDLLQSILERSENTHLFAVGDDWQSIYGFRGARPEYFVEFEQRFSPATTTRLDINYRCPPAVVSGSSSLMAESNLETDKSLEAASSNQEVRPSVYELAGSDDWQYETNVVTWAAGRVEQSLEVEERSPEDILVLARNQEGSPFVPRLSKELKTRDIAINKDRDSVTITTAHGAKGGEAEHVIILNAVSGRDDGFPPDEREAPLTQLVKTNRQDHFAEERRLFYVALTRAQAQLDIQTRVGHESPFLEPVDEHADNAPVPLDWGADRVSVTGRVTNPKQEISHHRQVGNLIVNEQRVPYIVPYDATEADLLEDGHRYRLENVAVGEYDGNPQLRIDDDAIVETE